MREMFFYSFNYVIYIVKYFFVGEADDGDVEIFEFCSAVDVAFMHIWVVVDSAIQFYYQIGFGTIEISDKLFDRMLTAEVIAVELVIAQVLPEQFLCRGHILAQLFCSREYLRRGTLEDFSFAEVVFHSCDFLPHLAICPLPAFCPLPASPKWGRRSPSRPPLKGRRSPTRPPLEGRR